MNRKPKLLNSYLSEELRANIGKNIFSVDFENSVMTLRITGKLLEELRNISLNYKHRVLEDLVNKVIRELCRVNQYYYFGEKEKKELKLLYASLLDRLLENSEDLEARLPEIRSSHVGNLRGWLLKTNPFAEKLYGSHQKTLEMTPCEEYSAEFQLQLFGLDPKAIAGPVLDVGCGEQSNLVSFLRNLGIEAYGIDRYRSDSPWIYETDLLALNYGKNNWGTIFSNLAFSNHFHHHHLRSDGQFEAYVQCYMRLLESLRPGGAFYYAPELPFVEKHLDKDKYLVETIAIPNLEIRASKVKRL